MFFESNNLWEEIGIRFLYLAGFVATSNVLPKMKHDKFTITFYLINCSWEKLRKVSSTSAPKSKDLIFTWRGSGQIIKKFITAFTLQNLLQLVKEFLIV